jgi:transglutaminase-like putative cysteine protease
MHPPLRRLFLPFIFTFILLSSNLLGSSSLIPPKSPQPTTNDLYLLRAEHYLYLKATEDTPTFTLLFSFPPDYSHQAPLYLEFYNDSSDKLLNYTLEDDTLEPNKLINCTISPLSKDEIILLHFDCWVLINGHEYEGLPNYVPIPQNATDLPEHTRKWLCATEGTQVNSILIKLKSRQISRLTTNLRTLADRITYFIKNHRYGLFLLQLNLKVFFRQDALTTLFINGDNVGRAHLACALFRANTIPARVILTLGDQPFWTQMHYIMEYYVPGYGWVIMDTTRAHTPHQPYRQVILRICHPEDEGDTKTDYIFPLMTGEERWLWFDTTTVEPYYIDCDNGSKSRMFQENIITTDPFTADYAHFLTRFAFHYYETYLGTNLSGQNLNHYQNATSLHHQALKLIQFNQDIHQYIVHISHAIDEYQQITQ